MRYICIVLGFATALIAVGVTPVHADKAKWCAFLGGRDGGSTECLYHTLDQCRATVSGFGGYCFENPDYVGVPERRKYRRPY